jgi:uncharacterized membrane protein YebE (DUF533 family)
MSALDRLKAPVFREGTDLAIVNRHDLALVLAVVEAAENAVGNVEDRQERRDLRQALEALTEDKP